MRRMIQIGAMTALVAWGAAARADQGFTFRTCAEARAAGYSNIPRGSYGYGPRLDRDNDGIACES